MNHFDNKALIWDNNPQRIEMTQIIAEHIKKNIPLNKKINAFEYGAGTGLLSVLLSPDLNHILTADTSQGMLNVLENKIKENKISNLTAVNLDLTIKNPPSEKYNLIYSSMTLHHIEDINHIFNVFYSMLEPLGHLVIVDLVKEDGSFHGNDFTGHNGFDLLSLKNLMQKNNLHVIQEEIIFKMNKTTIDNVQKQYPIFILIAQK